MTKAKAWMPIYIGDYLGDTQRLTTEQHGAYLLLIFDYWRNGPPPDDDEVLQQITLLDRSRWRKARPTISRFFEVADGVWTHKRIERERLQAMVNAERRSAKAKAAADARWNTPSNAEGMPDAMLGASPSPSPSPSIDKSMEGHRDLPAKIVEVWNNMAEVCDLPKVEKLTDSRRSKLAARIEDHGFEAFAEAIRRIPESSFLTGGGDRGWKATIDSMIRPDNAAKLIEGAYHGRTGKRSAWLNA